MTVAPFTALIGVGGRAAMAQGPTLRGLADKINLEIGCNFTGWWFRDPVWQSIVGREFNLGIIEWGLHWSEIEPQREQFNFDIIDRQLAFAEAHGIQTRAHNLIWRESSLLPDWLKNGSFSRDELIQIVRTHITQIMKHYQDRFSEWVIVNEPYIVPYRPTDFFHERIGPDYIEVAFQAARDAIPAATLIFNDTQNHVAGGILTASTHTMVQRLQGLIDGVGLQMHLLRNYQRGERSPARQDVIDTMRSYGVPVHVTELDVNLQDVPGSPDERYALQAGVFADMLQAALESGVCRSFTVWGIGDKFSWYEKSLNQPNADPTPFDDDLNPKPAYFAMRDVLRGAAGG